MAPARRLVIDPPTAAQVDQLHAIGDALLAVLDPTGRMDVLYGD